MYYWIYRIHTYKLAPVACLSPFSHATHKSTLEIHIPITYGSKALGTILIARLTSLVLHCPFSRPRAIPILFNTSISSCISKVLSKLNKYSYLEKIKHEDELLFVQQTNGIYFQYKLRAFPAIIT